jgi:phospholipase C
MDKRTWLWFLGLFGGTFALLLGLNSCGGSSTHGGGGGGGGTGQVQHVVVIFQENRSTDNLFQDSVLISRGADIVQSGLNSQGQTIPLTPGPLAAVYDLGHSHDAFVVTYDSGKMDGAGKVAVTCEIGVPNCPPSNPAYASVNPSEVAPYFQMAEKYTFADRMFQTNQGPSFPAHQFIISGTSAPAAGSTLFAAENPGDYVHADNNTGCIAPQGETVRLIDPAGDESQTMYPCFDHPTLQDSLDAKGISWRYYTPSAGSIWTGPNAIQHLCVPDPTATTCTGADWVNGVVLNEKSVLTDIADGQLAGVTWVIPSGQESDHPARTDGSGPSWVASIVNAIGNSAFWPNTVIFITWDDWGGWYDHVPPPKIINSYEYGFRVPLIVVSPYAKQAYISHATHDFGSILKFIEEQFNLPSLGYADAQADDLADCFDFTQKPTPFQTIPAPLNAAHFINDKRIPTDPDDD